MDPVNTSNFSLFREDTKKKKITDNLLNFLGKEKISVFGNKWRFNFPDILLNLTVKHVYATKLSSVNVVEAMRNQINLLGLLRNTNPHKGNIYRT